MVTKFSSESANWILPSYPTTFTSTLPNYEQSLPVHVNRGVTNYVKNRGTLNIGDWAIEGRRMSTSTLTESTIDQKRNIFEVSQPKVIGSDALRNYTKSRSSTPNLIYGNLEPPNPHHHLRVKKEGRANYDKNHNSQMKTLIHNYGKLPIETLPAPNTYGEIATNLFYTHQQGMVGPILNNYGQTGPSPRPNPNVKGIDAEINLQKGQGISRMLQHSASFRSPTPEPNVKGIQAQTNYEMGQGHHVNKLFHEYGKLPQSARTVPKIKYNGVENLIKGQGDAMRKTISQCPPSTRYLERPQSVPLWP